MTFTKASILTLSSLSLCGSGLATIIFVPIDITTGTGTTASQSSGYNGDQFPANLAIDGNLGNFTHTAGGDANPTWTGDLGRDETFNAVYVYNRGGGCCPERLSDITVSVLDSSDTAVYTSPLLNPSNSLGGPAVLEVGTGSITGRKIVVSRDGASTPEAGVLSLGEIVIGNIADVMLPLGTNLTQANILGLTTAQSPTSASPPGGGVAGNAVDGNFNNFTHTNADVNVDHSWQVDFGEEMLLESVSMFTRTSCCGGRLRDITVTVLDGVGGTVFTSVLLNPENVEGFGGTAGGQLDLDFAALNGGSPITGQTVVITRTPDPDSSGLGPGDTVSPDDSSVLSLSEVTVIGGSIPEPSSSLFIGLAALTIALRRKRR